MNKNFIAWLLGGLVVFVALGVGVWFFHQHRSSAAPTYTATTTPFSILVGTNPDFAIAQSLFNKGDYVGAIASYTRALSNASDMAQRGQIEFKIAVATARTGDKVGAIRLYKQIAADASNTPIARAAAVQSMGLLHYTTLDDSITGEIFTGDPYQSFLVAGDPVLSYRHLFEYASSFYPLAQSEVYIANWYAADIVGLYKKGIASTSPEVKDELAIVQQKFAAASADMQRIQPDPNSNGSIPSILQLEAMTMTQLSFAKLLPLDTTETAYKTALAAFQTYSLPPGSDVYARYYYALFLTYYYGTKRASDIQQLMKPLYTDPGHEQYASTAFFKNIRVANDSLRMSRVASVAKIDPAFKAYLISLGWTNADFK